MNWPTLYRDRLGNARFLRPVVFSRLRIKSLRQPRMSGFLTFSPLCALSFFLASPLVSSFSHPPKFQTKSVCTDDPIGENDRR